MAESAVPASVEFVESVPGRAAGRLFRASTPRSSQDGQPLIIRIKAAARSVLETYVGKSRYRHHGQRVVGGQRRMQAAIASGRFKADASVIPTSTVPARVKAPRPATVGVAA